MKQLKELIEILEKDGLLASITENVANIAPTGFTTNSKAAAPGTFFVCKGFTFKKEYLEMARDKGAVCYLADQDFGVDLPHILVTDIRKAVSHAARWYYDNPGSQMVLTGMTGTKGKTTTAYILKSIMDAQEEARTALFSTCEIVTGRTTRVSHLTTPEPAELQAYFREAVDEGCNRVIMEVSSQAMKLSRVYGEKYKVGIFLNIGDDHIGTNEHASKEEYIACKVAFLSQCENCVINNATDYLDQVLAGVPKDSRLIRYGYGEECEARISDVDSDAGGSRFRVTFDGITESYSTNLVGRFNVENMTAAIVSAKLLGIPEEFIKKGVSRVSIPGRMMIFDAGDFHVVIDYAHNYLSCYNLYQAIKEAFAPKHIIALFGSAGERAESRKQDQGLVADMFADHIFLTTDDPGFEDPAQIAADISTFIKSKPFQIILDREQAVYAALNAAVPGDVVVMMGKGTDRTMRVGNQHVPYISDVVATENWIEKHKKN